MSSLDPSRQQCRDCGASPPPTESNYTLISSQHGWRCVIAVNDKGEKMTVWRCASCWAKHREQIKPSVGRTTDATSFPRRSRTPTGGR